MSVCCTCETPAGRRRNRLIHAYFDVDLDVLWRTALDDMPQLQTLLDALLGE